MRELIRGWASRLGAPGRGRRTWLIIARTLVALVSTTALAATGVAWQTVGRLKASTNTTPALAQLRTVPHEPPPDDSATDILLVGDDSRTDAQGNPLSAGVLRQLRTTFDSGVNTDTIILLRLPRNGGKAYAVSIPRDTYVAVPGYRTSKINAAYGVIKAQTADRLGGSGLGNAAIEQQSSVAGQKALIQTVQDLTGDRVDHYVEVNLYGFYLLSKAIGGVDVCLRHATSDPDSGASFRAGKQNVSGSSALSFVRQRKNLPDGDLSRIVRQQVFLAAALRKVLSVGTLTNPAELSALMDTMRKSLTTDPDLDLVTLAQQAQALVSGNLEFVTIPVLDANARSADGQSIVAVDVDQVHRFMATLTAGTPPTTTAAPAPVPPAKSGPAPPPTTTTTTTAPPPPSSPTTTEPTPPVSVDGVRCVD